MEITASKKKHDYLDLARKRVETVWPPYKQPEDFGYDFKDWVSPYTKGANRDGGIAIVLQDWASADGLEGGPDPSIQAHGRKPSLLTNRRLEAALDAAFGLTLAETYVTNVFPFVKAGGMSSIIPASDVRRAAKIFTKVELKLAEPKIVFALGKRTQDALESARVEFMPLPHPAARGMSTESYCLKWKEAANAHGFRLDRSNP